MPLNGEVCEFPSEPKVGAVFHLATTGLKKSMVLGLTFTCLLSMLILSIALEDIDIEPSD